MTRLKGASRREPAAPCPGSAEGTPGRADEETDKAEGLLLPEQRLKARKVTDTGCATSPSYPASIPTTIVGPSLRKGRCPVPRRLFPLPRLLLLSTQPQSFFGPRHCREGVQKSGVNPQGFTPLLTPGILPPRRIRTADQLTRIKQLLFKILTAYPRLR